MAARASRRLSEKQFQAQVTDLCDWLSLTWYHTHDSRRSPSGFPDLVVVGPGGVIFVELKSEKGKVTQAQQHWLDLLHETQRTYVWRPSDWEWAQNILFRLAGRRVQSLNTLR